MFTVNEKILYAIHNRKEQKVIKNISPYIDIHFYEKKRKTICSSAKYYEDYNIELESICRINTSKGDYLAFSFRDYNHQNNIEFIYFEILHREKPYMENEYYQVVFYDDNCFELYVPISKWLFFVPKINLRINKVGLFDVSSEKLVLGRYLYISNKAKIENLIVDKDKISNLKDNSKNNCEEENFELWLMKECEKLEQKINMLPASINQIDITPPINDDEIIYVPIECTFNKKFYGRIYLMREHCVENLIISPLDLLQYQIPMKITNEPLLLIIYGSHWLTPINDPLVNIYGENLCDDIEEKACYCSPILSNIAIIEKRFSSIESKQSVKMTEAWKRYEFCRHRLYEWIDMRMQETFQYSECIRPSLWKSEYKLYKYVKILCPDTIYQYRAQWLGSQSIDMYIPSFLCAIEYQGKQHYESIDYFGGETAFEDRKKDDVTKRNKCRENGIKLCEWMYSEKITMSKVFEFLNTRVFDIPHDRESFVNQRLKEMVPFDISSLFISDTYTQIQKTLNDKNDVKEAVVEYEIRQYDTDGRYITNFSTIIEAARMVEISKQQIQKVIRGIALTAGSYQWRKVEKGTPIENISPVKEYDGCPIAKAIYQISLDGEIINEFSSINSAERSTKINRKSIRAVLSGFQKTAGGYYWMFKER